MGVPLEWKHALRQLRRHPAHAAVVVSTLALGIGSASAIFSFVQGVLLRPLPYPDPSALVMVCETHRDRDPDWCGGSPANLRDWRRASRMLQSIGLARSWPFGLKGDDGRFRSLQGGVATAGTFEIFGVQPLLGRLLREGDHEPGADHVVLLTHGLWSDRFGSDPEIVGRAINLDEEHYEIVGVLPAGFEIPHLERVDLWIPLWAERVDWRDWRGLRPYGRLAPGVSLEEARAEMATIGKRLASEYPESNAEWGLRVERLQDRIVAPVRTALLLLLGAVGFVLLIACANAANLLLARATSRERELAVRAALGEAPARMIRALLTDTLVLAVLGGGLGILLATWLVSLFVGLAPPGFPRLDEVALDGTVLGFALGLTILTCLLAGLFPAWHASRVDPHRALREGRGTNTTVASHRARDVLVVAEIAMAFVLLIGAGLLMRSFWNLTSWEPGFDTERLLAFSVFPPLGKYPDAEQLDSLYRRTNERLRAIPGVVSAGEVSAGPLFGGGDGIGELRVEGRPEPAQGAYPAAAWFDCGPDYFQTLGLPLRRGRLFGPDDGPASPPVAIINETMARRYWPGEDPIGARVQMRRFGPSREIVGVIADVVPFDPREPEPPRIYWPLRQAMRGATFYIVRTAVDPGTLVSSVRAALNEIEPDMGIGTPASLDQRIAGELVRPRFQLLLLGIFSVLAFTIATLGVYGIVSYSVARRTHEFGVRLALGARTRQLLGMVLRRGLRLAAAGTLLGIAGSLALTRLLESLLVEVRPTDPGTFLFVVGFVLVVAVLASLLPARRAARVDPLTALRVE